MIAAAAVLALLASGVITYRVLAPTDISYPALRALPKPASPAAKAYGRYAATPLIVESRLRIFAANRQIRADGPVDAGEQRTPVWSYRRWPAQVAGVVTVGTTVGNVVVSRWSDGRLVGVDVRTGRELWQTAVPAGPGEFTGRRTGAQTVYAPVGLHTLGADVLVLGGTELVSVDGATGRIGWRAAVAAGCASGFTTASGRFVCAESGAAYDGRSGAAQSGGPAGPLVPHGCAVARSGCTGMVDGAGQGWLTGTVKPVRSRALDAAGATLDGTGRLALTVAGPEVVATDAVAGTVTWRWRAPAGVTPRIVGGQPGYVHVLAGPNALVNVSSRTGMTASTLNLLVKPEKKPFSIGYTYAVDGFVVVERLAPQAEPSDPDYGYFYGKEPVVIAGTGR
jgi:hypothetical protein